MDYEYSFEPPHCDSSNEYIHSLSLIFVPYFSLIIDLGSHSNYLNEMVLMSTRNPCFEQKK